MAEEQSHIPQSKLGRSSVVGKTAVRVGLKKAGHATRQPFRSKARRLQARIESDEDIAKLVFDALVKLRGTALKAAQVLAGELELVPEAYREQLARACSEVPSLNRALVRSLVTRQLGPPQRVFASLASTPFAAASLGQVHAGTTHAGERVAVKVQYPGMPATVDADIALLTGLLSVTRWKKVFAACIEEVRQQLHEELDYEVEAAHTSWFREHLALADVIVPAVHPDLSTRRVLTTTRIDGLHLDAWLRTDPPQALRDHYGQLFVDLFNHMVFELRALHADPNFGNYLLRDDGRLGVIDFGCVKHLDDALVAALVPLFYGQADASPAAIRDLHELLGVHYKSDDSDAFATFLTEWSAWTALPYQHERFDCSSGCAAYFDAGMGFAREFYRRLERYDGSFIYFGRAQHGLLRILQRLGANVRMAPKPNTS